MPGKWADLTVVSLDGLAAVDPLKILLSAAVLGGSPERVAATLVAGEDRYRRGDERMARFEKSRPKSAKPHAAVAPARRRGTTAPSIEDTMFFPRLRRHAKWMFVLLALVFGLGFVVFGVGAGGTGVGDIFRGSGGTSAQSVSDARSETEERPKDPQAWRDLATALETEGQTDEAIVALNTRHRSDAEGRERATASSPAST